MVASKAAGYTRICNLHGPEISLKVAMKLWNLGYYKTWSGGVNRVYFNMKRGTPWYVL